MLIKENYNVKYPDYYTGSTQRTRVTGIDYDRSRLPNVGGAISEQRSIYSSALARFTDRLKTARSDFSRAEEPLSETADLYREGGGYGASQKAIVDKQSREALGKGQTSLVASGMASGSTMAGLHSNIALGRTVGHLAIEDMRSDNLAQALTALANLRAGAAGAMLGAQEPDSASMAGNIASLSANELNAMAGLESSRMGAEASYFGTGVSANASMASSLISGNSRIGTATAAGNAGLTAQEREQAFETNMAQRGIGYNTSGWYSARASAGL